MARVEGLGPASLEQLRDLLGHARVTVKPVLDLANHLSVTCYEHPESIKERIHLIRPVDAFPHASLTSRKVDLDQPVPYDTLGPPAQTSTRTSQPLGRRGHRAKTHLGYTATPLGTGVTLWRTPHGLARLVVGVGTHRIGRDLASALTGDDPLDRSLAHFEHQHRTASSADRLSPQAMSGRPGGGD